MQTVEDPDVLRWARETLAMLRTHVEQAPWTKMVLFAMDKPAGRRSLRLGLEGRCGG